MSGEPLLSVNGLEIGFDQPDGGWNEAVRNLSLEVRCGESTAIIGESGSGKSLAALACLGLVPEPGRIVGGKIVTCGTNVLRASPSELQNLRGNEVGFVFQEASSALNPVYTVGFQLAEAVGLRLRFERRRRRATVLRRLAEVAIEDPERVARCYPHELSGGISQRVMLALALSRDPRLLIADEPTTALDTVTEKQVLDLIARLARDRGLTTVLITHDVELVEATVDQVLVMLHGELVEVAPCEVFFEQPQHPYSRLLCGVEHTDFDLPSRARSVENGRVPLHGCVFRPRCPLAEDECSRSRPPMIEIGPGHRARCPVVASTSPSRGDHE